MSEQFIGPYRLLAILGHGPNTIVYKAWQDTLDRAVTLKVVTRPDASALYRLQAEAQLAANLADPNIRQVYEAGQTPDGQVYVALQFVDYSLRELMQQRFAAGRTFTRTEVANLLAPIASALDNLHKHKLTYLDIKPENILIFKDTGRTVLADLGIAQPHGTWTRAGTPLYSSPEQAAGDRPIGPWCDVYSLGIVAYEMLTGRTPFQGSLDVAVLRLHLEEQPPPLRRFRRDIPADLERIVLRALSKDPRQRFPSASAFVEAIRQPPAPLTDAVRRTTVILRRTPQIIRQPWAWGTIASLIVVLAGAAALVSGWNLLKPDLRPTATLTATSTPVTATPSPMVTPTATQPPPTTTPSRTPTPSATYTPYTPSLTPQTPTPIYPAPILVQPASNTTLHANQMTDLVWAWGDRELKPDERFRVRMTGPSSVQILTRDNFVTMGRPAGGPGTYSWTVDVVRVDSSGNVIQALSGASAPWQLSWQ